MISQGKSAAAAKSLQLCPTLCDPIDGSPPGSPVPGILQARILEWVAISFSNAWKWKVKVKLLSRAWLLATPWTAAYQAPPSMGFSRQEYWSGVPLPSPQGKSTNTEKQMIFNVWQNPLQIKKKKEKKSRWFDALLIFLSLDKSGTLSNSFYEVSITLIPRSNKDSTRKRKWQRAIFTYVYWYKILNKILANRIHDYVAFIPKIIQYH